MCVCVCGLNRFVSGAEMRISPTKPCGKGSKRKQDELDEDDDDYDEEAEHPTWVDALTQELADDDAPEEDPDYEVGERAWRLPHDRSSERPLLLRPLVLPLLLCSLQPSTVETESEEYRSHNNTESDIEIQEKGLVVIQDVNTVRWQRPWGKRGHAVNDAFSLYIG